MFFDIIHLWNMPYEHVSLKVQVRKPRWEAKQVVQIMQCVFASKSKIAKCMWICKICIHTCLKLQEQVAAPPAHCTQRSHITYAARIHFYNDLKRECTNYFNCGQYVYMYRKSGLQRTLIYFLLAATFLSCRFIGSTSTCLGLWSLQ